MAQIKYFNHREGWVCVCEAGIYQKTIKSLYVIRRRGRLRDCASLKNKRDNFLLQFLLGFLSESCLRSTILSFFSFFLIYMPRKKKKDVI